MLHLNQFSLYGIRNNDSSESMSFEDDPVEISLKIIVQQPETLRKDSDFVYYYYDYDPQTYNSDNENTVITSVTKLRKMFNKRKGQAWRLNADNQSLKSNNYNYNYQKRLTTLKKHPSKQLGNKSLRFVKYDFNINAANTS